MANTKLTRTFGSGGSGTKWTLSAWIKRSKTGIDQYIMSRYVTGTKYVKILFNDQDTLEYSVYNNNAGGYQGRYKTTAKYRDTSAWYHIVIAQDTSLGTAADRVKFYINGELITSFGTNSQLGQNVNGDFNTATPHQIGAYNSTNYFQGSMSHFHFCDNQQYAASNFGSVDSVTGEWQINTSPSVNYGTTGFLVLKDGNTVTDQSSNSNNWSVGGTLTKTQDCPSNNFPTLLTYEATDSNALIDDRTNGNTVGRSTTSGYSNYFATMGATSGKYYWEFKYLAGAANNINIGGGIRLADSLKGMGLDAYATAAGAWIVAYDGRKFNTVAGKSAANFTSGQSNNDICHIAWNATIGAWWFGVNGTWAASATDSEIAAGTVTHAVYSSLDTTRPYVPCCFDAHTTGNTHDFAFNFGNGFFASTAVSSAGTNASGNGIFEFNVPAGFTALSTKGLNI